MKTVKSSVLHICLTAATDTYYFYDTAIPIYVYHGISPLVSCVGTADTASRDQSRTKSPISEQQTTILLPWQEQ